MNVHNTMLGSKCGHLFLFTKRVTRSRAGRLTLACVAMASLMAVPLPTGAGDREDHDRKDDDQPEHEVTAKRIEQGFAIAPVPLDLKGKNRNLVGLGSYIVNAQGGCNDCHTAPPFAAGGNPFLGEPMQVNSANYLGGGVEFGPFVSRNITPDEHGRPAGLTRAEFITAMRTGIDKDGDILQVMPWPVFAQMTDRDLKAVYEYLRSIPSLDGPGSRDP